MTSRPLAHLTDAELLGDFERVLAKHREDTAQTLAALAEYDARRLYLGDGFLSMELFCKYVLHDDEDEIPLRLKVARHARKFPVLFEAIADGRLSLEAVSILADEMTADNADELIAAASFKKTGEIYEMLLERDGLQHGA